MTITHHFRLRRGVAHFESNASPLGLDIIAPTFSTTFPLQDIIHLHSLLVDVCIGLCELQFSSKTLLLTMSNIGNQKLFPALSLNEQPVECQHGVRQLLVAPV